MKTRLRELLSISDKGASDTLKAGFFAFLKFFVFTLGPILVFIFLKDLINNNIKNLSFYFGLLAVFAIIIYLIIFREYTLTYDTTYKESANLRINIANKLKNLPLSYFSKHNLSDLSQSVMMDVSNIEMTLSHSIPQIIGFLYFLIFMTIMLVANSPLMGLAVTLPIWIDIILLIVSKKIQTKRVTKYYYKLLENSNSFQEAFEMQEEIKSYSMQDTTMKKVFKDLDDAETLHKKSEFFMAFMISLIGISPYISPAITAIVGAKLFNSGSIDILYFVGYLMGATALSSHLGSINQFIAMIFFFEDSFKRIRDLSGEQTQAGLNKEIKIFDIEFKNVEFSYGDNKVIKDISFLAKQGQVTALVGPSGCGKTTVLRLISRLYDYDKGSILVGGEDIKYVSTKSLFDKVSIVFQDVELFNTSVLENIRIGNKEATDGEVIKAAKLANVDEIVENLADGYDTVIGENGSRLSGGERQRISIARAFLKNAPIVLLDEISASLDVENEMKIQNSINKLIENKTVIIVSHRLKSIENVDNIIIMKEGRIDAQGNHDQLLKTSKLYGSMIEKSKLTDAYIY